jgi:hypothetical protein
MSPTDQFAHWTGELDDELDTLARAPYFVLYPSGLRDVCHEMRRLRVGGRPSHDDGDDPTIDSAHQLQRHLDEARVDLSELEYTRLVRHVEDRLEAALR